MAIINGDQNPNNLNDNLTGTTGNDTILGREGNDQIFGGGGAHDDLFGGNGKDFIDASNGGNHFLFGEGGDDQLSGGNGNDKLDGGKGSDVMQGGAGDDTYTIDSNSDGVVEFANGGNDFVQSAVIAFTLPDSVENLRLLESTLSSAGFGNELDNSIIGNSNSNDLRGFDGKDFLNGGDGDDLLSGGSGDDQLFSGNRGQLTNDGNDLLDGGTGADLMGGGSGDDTYIVDNSGDQVSELEVVGFDTVKSSVTFTLPANVEKLILTGTGNISGTGNTGNNNIIGNDGGNVLGGNGGDDFLDGGKGLDTVQETTDSDFSLSKNILSFAGGVDELVNIEEVRLFGGASNNTLNAANFSGNVSLVGNGGRDTLIGGSGNDFLAGDDFFVGGAVSDDVIIGGGGIDTVFGETSTNFTLTNTSLKGQGNDTLSSIEKGDLFGSDGNNTFDASAFSGSVEASGGNGNDVLLGAKGGDNFFGGNNSDVVAGGAGNDSLAGAFGALTNDDAQDKFVYNTGVAFKAVDIGIDTIQDFAHNSDKIVLDKKTFTSISSNTGTGFGQSSEFKVVTSDSAAQTSSADIVYNSANGKLFYNQNGTSSGFGSGAQFATLTGKPTLSATDFLLQSGSTLGLIKSTPVTLGSNSNNIIQGQNIGGIVDGRGGKDTLFARGGNDVVLGGDGNDSLDGGKGDDILFGGADRDTLKGGKGGDTFVLAPGTGVDVIKDYKDGIDKLGLANDVSFDQLQFVQRGSRTVIQSGGHNLAVVNGTQANQFSATDFVSISFSKFDGMNVPMIVG